ncbi:hypothetical protein B0T25DRAFT_543703, partial [Lasiosphaeria hispida]
MCERNICYRQMVPHPGICITGAWYVCMTKPSISVTVTCNATTGNQRYLPYSTTQLPNLPLKRCWNTSTRPRPAVRAPAGHVGSGLLGCNHGLIRTTVNSLLGRVRKALSTTRSASIASKAIRKSELAVANPETPAASLRWLAARLQLLGIHPTGKHTIRLGDTLEAHGPVSAPLFSIPPITMTTRLTSALRGTFSSCSNQSALNSRIQPSCRCQSFCIICQKNSAVVSSTPMPPYSSV